MITGCMPVHERNKVHSLFVNKTEFNMSSHNHAHPLFNNIHSRISRIKKDRAVALGLYKLDNHGAAVS